ncbi:MAG: hypothetical protein U5L96_14175 [Owenweeksia sp.]|nr:hypothetical protein [Owenweeksia sp.]
MNFNGINASLRLAKLHFSPIALILCSWGYSHLFSDREEFDYESLYVFDYLKNKAIMRVQHGLTKSLVY